MKKHQFEEILATLSTIAYLLAAHFEMRTAAGFLAVKAGLDWGCLLLVIYLKERKKKS